MLYQTGDAIPFLAQFTASKAGATGLTVTVAVVRLNPDGTRTTVVSAASVTAATELDATNAKGLYGYWLAGANTGAAGAYLATFHTAGTADLADVAALELVGPAWVAHVNADVTSRAAAADYTTARAAKLDNLDASVASRSSHSAADVWAVGTRTLSSFGTLVSDIWANASRTLSAFGFGVTVATNTDKTGYSLATAPPTAAAITNAVLDELLAGHTTTGSVAAGISAAGAAGDPLSSVVPGTYSAGTAGYRIGHLTDVQLQYVSPVLAGGTLSLVAGVAYQAERGNAIVFPALTSSAPDLSAATVTLEISYSTTVVKSLPCTVSGPTSAQVITVDDITVAQNTLGEGDRYRYSVWARWADGDADAVPLLAGPCIVAARP